MKIQAIRGMHDLFGAEINSWQSLEQTFRTIFEAFGYQEIRTPILEKLEVFSQTVGEDTDIVEKQMYVVDHNEGKLALRPEGTAAFMRAVIQHQLHRSGGTQRYYYYLPMYRHERPQKGRFRQFYQFGAELINDASPEADAEMIVLLNHLYQAVNLSEYVIKINSVGCEACRPAYRNLLQDFLKPQLDQLCGQCQKRFERAPMRILDCKVEACRKIVKKAPVLTDHLCGICKSHHALLKERLTLAQVSFEEDPYIVRGLDYYCRTAFEFVCDLLGAQSALVGGGRYDALAERFGEKPIPAVGFALGMERLLLALEAKQAVPQVKRHPFCYLAPIGEKAFEYLFPVGLNLKRQGVWVELSYEKGKSLKALLKQAGRSEAPFTVVLGENELNQSQVVLKDMAKGQQETLPLAKLESELLRRWQSAH